MNRPLVVVAVAFVLGTFAAVSGCLGGWVLPLVLMAVGLSLPLVRGRPSRGLQVAVCFFASGALLWNARHAAPPGDALSRALVREPTPEWSVEGVVRETSPLLPGYDYLRLVVDIDTLCAEGAEEPTYGGLLVRWSHPEHPVYVGDRVRLRGALSPTIGYVNPRIEDIEDYMRRHGVHSSARVQGRGLERIRPGRWWGPFHLLSRIRQAQAERLFRAVPARAQPFVLAVWLGDRSQLTRQERDEYVCSGTAHILAVSGVHASIVFVSLSFLLRTFMRNRRWRAALCMIVVFLFAFLAGARITALRAAVMIGLYMVADLFDRERDAATSLSLSGLLFAIWNPDVLLDSAFQLSFLSVSSLLLFTHIRLPERIRASRSAAAWTRVPRVLREGLTTTVVVQVLPLPVAIGCFHVLPIAAPLANLVVLPLLAAALWLCFLTSVTAWFAPSLAGLFGHGLVPVVASIEAIVRSVASVKALAPCLTSPTLLASAAYWGLIGMVCAACMARKRARLYVVAATLCAAVCLVGWKPPARAEMVVLDVGAGDAIFVRSKAGPVILVDGGMRSSFVDMGERIVAPFLWACGVTHIDTVVVTHADLDHIGGLTFVVERFSVDRVLMGPESDREAERDFLAVCAVRRVPVMRVARGDRVEVEGWPLTVLHPPASWPPTGEPNDASLVLRFSVGEASVLLTGDIEWAGERELAGQDCQADVLKVPHHGSSTSSSEVLLEAVRPLFAVVSADRERGAGAIPFEVAARYARHAIPLVGTHALGGIRITASRGEIRAIGERQRRGYPHR